MLNMLHLCILSPKLNWNFSEIRNILMSLPPWHLEQCLMNSCESVTMFVELRDEGFKTKKYCIQISSLRDLIAVMAQCE